MKAKLLLFPACLVFLAFCPPAHGAVSAEAPGPGAEQEHASPLPATPSPAGDNAAGSDNTWADRYHVHFEEDLLATVLWFDRFFGGDKVEVRKPPETTLRWGNDFRWDEREGFTYRTRVRARVRLPRLQGRWRLLISGENRGDTAAAAPEDPGNPGLDEASRTRVASTELVYDLLRKKRFVVDLGAGVEIKLPVNAFVRAQLQYTRDLGPRTLGRFTATPFWNARKKFGESNRLDFEHRLAPHAVLAWSNSLSIHQGSNGWNWGTDLSLLRKISPVSAVTFGGSMIGPTRPDPAVLTYRGYARYRRGVLRSWLFCELEPDIRWPRDDGGGRKSVWGGTIRLEVFFTGRDAAGDRRPPGDR